MQNEERKEIARLIGTIYHLNRMSPKERGAIQEIVRAYGASNSGLDFQQRTGAIPHEFASDRAVYKRISTIQHNLANRAVLEKGLGRNPD